MKARHLAILALLLVSTALQAQIRVAVEDGSSSGTGSQIVTQLNDDTWADFSATLVTASDIDTLGELSNYDVVILGGSGTGGGDDWTVEMADALSQFVTAGGGAILTGWGNFNMARSSVPEVRAVLEAIFPTQNTAQYSNDRSGAQLVITQSHPITDGLSDFSIGTGCCTELNSHSLETGDSELATMNGSTVVATKEPGAGFSVYLGHIFMASTSYSVLPALRTGNPDRLLEQAVVWAASGEDLEQGNAIFKVTKTFLDGSIDTVDVTLTCSAGLPLQQNFTIAGDGPGVSFTVTDIAPNGATCSVTESGGPDGYEPVMNDGSGCSWDNVTGGAYVCEIVNVGEEATFTVEMEWSVESETGGNTFDDEVPVTIWCDTMIEPYSGEMNDDWYYDTVLGDGDSEVVTVDTSTGSASCWANQDAGNVSGVESSDNCAPQDVSVGEAASCTFTNTLFFEGIPTLSQYGMALMALLMLGIGFVGFRRLV